MTEIMGYADAISTAPGDRIAFKVSCEGAQTYRARIVRVLSPEVGPDGPPFRTEALAPAFTLPARTQALRNGSWAIVPAHPLLAALRSFTVQAMVWPTLPGRGRQAIMGTWSETLGSGFGLMLDGDGALQLRVGGATIAGARLDARRWYFIAGSYDADTGAMRLVQRAIADRGMAAPMAVVTHGRATGTFVAHEAALLFAAWHDADSDGLDGARPRVGGCFNGKIDRPRLAAAALDDTQMALLAEAAIPSSLAAAIVGFWDFARDIPTAAIRDLSPNRLDGATVNLPARAVTGHNWDASEMNWRRAPDQYGAIHFHDDDMIDARWHTDFTFDIPIDLRSGCYAAVLEAAEARWHVPFFVRSPASGPTAGIVYLAATATYTVYCNNIGRFRSTLAELYHGRVTVMDAVDMMLLKHPELGFSTYDRHGDGSGVFYASRLRPATNIRPTGRLWNYCVDMMIIDWLDRSGLTFDVVTDEDLALRGLDAIRPYRVLVTGSHPEYDSLGMLDALDHWVRRGGRLMYMGGNGFYWRIAHQPDNAAVIEVRRAEGGTRSWDAEGGEYYHSFTGEYGGLWRRNNRPPNLLAGVGFISQGFDHSSPYRRTAASHDPRVAFMFEGVTEEILGDFGLMQDGAAGMEIDCVDHALGTPPHALVVASSFDHSNTYELVVEEVRVPHGMSDGTANAAIRADMTFFETPGGGAVFSTGSIAYAGALGHNGFNNPIAKLTTNVLRRFADPRRFEIPRL
ncbi:MAG TPA: N,N-dimethylformamidase beta subunit family domain-containing protein [Acetobacteraceae bacterium]|jgi:N,N-dimethylformamidase|nr:N,N-dimethylformamidase beta subunit family domain-containing protein [Acetobacteraceae bacterium]